jgi:hypothetical protein
MSTNETDMQEQIAPEATDEDLVAGATTPQADDDDVEGHNMGAMNPTMARMLSESREKDIARSASRDSLLGQMKKSLTKKR